MILEENLAYLRNCMSTLLMRVFAGALCLEDGCESPLRISRLLPMTMSVW